MVLFVYLFIFGCAGSLLLHMGFLQLQQVGATLHCGAQASLCGGFSCCGAWALGTQVSVVAACRLSSCGTQAPEHAGFSSCSMWAQQLWCTDFSSYGAQAQQLWCMGLVALRHVGSSQTRDQTCVPCTGMWILNHWTTREVLQGPCFILDSQTIFILQLKVCIPFPL